MRGRRLGLWTFDSQPKSSKKAVHSSPTPLLDVSSCGGTKEKAAKNLKEAVRLFLEEAAKMGTLDQILEKL